MAKVQWSAGIDSVSGALAKPSNNPQHSCEHMLLGTHRKAATTSSDCNRLYMSKKVVRTKPLSQDEQGARIRFTAVTQAVAARRKDLMKITADQQAFEAQKNLSTGCKTMTKYLWSICGDEYDAQH